MTKPTSPPGQRKGLPEGYTPHAGGPCPVDPDWYVDVIVRTAEGLGHAGPQRAKLHEWEHHKHPRGIGAVVGYREASPSEIIPREELHARWPE